MRSYLYLLVIILTAALSAQHSSPPLTIEKIMQRPVDWIGSEPENIYWSEDSKWIYFDWNPQHVESDSLYKVAIAGGSPVKVGPEERKNLPAATGDYDRRYRRKVFSRDGDLYVYDIGKLRLHQVTHTTDREVSPQFSGDGNAIVYIRGDNLFLWDMVSGHTRQLTDFRSGRESEKDRLPANSNDRWIQAEEKKLFEVLRQREEQSALARRRKEFSEPNTPLAIYTGSGSPAGQQLSPDQRYITFRIETSPEGAKPTSVPNYITRDGYTEELNARSKVGSPQTTFRFGIYDIPRDTVYYVDADQIPGIYDRPDYLTKPGDTTKVARNTIIYGPYWSSDAENAVVVARAWDNKDRWILSLDPETASLKLLDRQHDDAWIGGPGISGWTFSPGNIGWLPDDRHIWFQSEESGYSHLYLIDIATGQKRALTSGKFEVTDVQLSRDGKTWYLTTSKIHPGERQLYTLPAQGGTLKQITRRTGNHDSYLSPDEKHLAIRFSSANQPAQLFVQPNKPSGNLRQLTNGLTDDFKAYDWRMPEFITFSARDGATVHARLYRPEIVKPNGPAVIFVHGAGYLQNAHKWWSTYFREYMFHNFLVDQGYTVLDIDYRASAGYGRDWRTAIYRDMGGKDLDDQVDGARMLVKEYQVDAGRIGIYGGSYGGFITFMALFTEPEVFACGAALRPVTDWAHYNHPYTSNILNEPQADSIAYRRSSPIYHAEGLTKPLLICHGMVDTNVHFQDVVRLAQRLIELGKQDWELAVYPVEGHGFREPSSWTDEYRRIFKLFEAHLK